MPPKDNKYIQALKENENVLGLAGAGRRVDETVKGMPISEEFQRLMSGGTEGGR
jgi:hypothetical protein